MKQMLESCYLVHFEALSPEEAGTNVSYIDKMEDNLDSLKVALECQ